MKKNIFTTIISVLFTILLLSSCVQEDKYEDTNKGNFEALWKLMDEHYCFFDYKKEQLGVDWNEVHSRYSSYVNSKMTTLQLFEVLCNMVGELQDGHVNIGASFDLGRNWSYFEEFPQNYNDSIAGLYLGYDYYIASGLKYQIMDDNIAYVRCSSFESSFGDGNISNMLSLVSMCRGMVLDLRGNGGGQLTTAHRLAARFVSEKTLIGYTCHKTGKGHNDFSAPEEEYLKPYAGLRWSKPVVVLTNRKCYSATNDFVKCVKGAPNVVIMGDRTGGGSGMPFSSELPNGWSVRYSAVVHYDKDMKHTEFGIEPDVKLEMSGADTGNNRDTYIEAAREYIRNISVE